MAPEYVFFAPDSLTFAVANQNGEKVSLWHTDGTSAGSLDEQDGTTSVAFSPDGRFIATGTNDSFLVHLWNSQDLSLIYRWQGHVDTITQLAFSPDGNLLASTANDHALMVWDTSDGRLLYNIPDAHKKEVNSIVFSPDGQILASADGQIILRLARDGSLLNALPGHIGVTTKLLFSSDGTILISGGTDGLIRIWGVR
ncbi:MAG: WD40 repeat domain-containing protein [Chloroflexota bacterium]